MDCCALMKSGCRALLAALSIALLGALAPAAASAAPLTVTLTGNGEGTVTSSAGTPDPIDCSISGGVVSGDCSTTIPDFTPVTLTAGAGGGSTFAGWAVGAGNCDGTDTPCTILSVSPSIPFALTAEFTIPETLPNVEIDAVAPGDVSATGATFHGSVDPNDSSLNACRFEWVREDDPGGFGGTGVESEPCDPDPGDGDDPVEVEATATGLQPNTTYRVRLLAAKASTIETIDEADDPFTTEAVPPLVTTGRAWSVSDTTATLEGTVDPQSSSTAYRFEYVTEEEFQQEGFDGAASTPVQDAGSGGAAVQVTAEVEGLQPAAAYRFRLLSDNGVPLDPECDPECETLVDGDGASFATRLPIVFPERAYELVSALETNGINAETVLASADGERYAYKTYIPAPGSESAHTNYHFVSQRSADGSWSPAPCCAPTPPPGEQIGVSQPLLSGDLSVAAFATGQALDPDDQAGPQGGSSGGDVYVRDLGTGALTWASRDPAIAPGTLQTDPANADDVLYVSAAGERVYFRPRRHLLPTDNGGGTSQTASLYQWTRQPGAGGQLSLVGILPGQTEGTAEGSTLGSGDHRMNAVSRDGSRVAFSSPPDGSDRRLYLRLEGESTVEVSDGPGAVYRGADSEMTKVFYTRDDDLFAYFVDDGTRLNLSQGGGVQRVYVVAGDGSRVYFASAAKLTGGEEGTAGESNLYLAESAGSGDPVQLTFVATVDDPDGFSNNYGLEQFRERRADDDASLLAFRSVVSPIPGRATGGEPQIFLYDAARDQVGCVSCPTDGSEPTGPANLTPSSYIGGGSLIPNGGTADLLPPSRNVTDDGTVFFQTETALLPADVNGRIDVYEYRGGKLRLVSAGTGPLHARFAGASADGGTVFFRAADSLVPGVPSGIARIYAARTGGGFVPPPAPSPPCAGGDCREPAAAAPDPPGAASSVLRGGGNLRPAARRGNRCARFGRRARSLGGRAQRLRRGAARVSGVRRSRLMRRRALRLARQARRQGLRASRCRQGERRARR